jgi:hypothetical protein
MLLALSLLIGVALAQPGRFNSKLTFTGNVETDFATNGVLKRGVVLLKDETPSVNGPVSSPDVGLPPTQQWVGLLSGWDIKDIHFQFDFEYVVLFLRIFFFFFLHFFFFFFLCGVSTMLPLRTIARAPTHHAIVDWIQMF